MLEGVNMIAAVDYTPQFVDYGVLVRMCEALDDRPAVFDFDDVNVMDRDIDALAHIVSNHRVIVYGLDDSSQALLDSYIRKLNAPDFSTLEEFVDMFESKFPKGTLCIWDKSLNKKRPVSENKLSLVMIEGVKGNHVWFRLYHSHLVEPKYFNQYGGLDSPELYKMENVHISDVSNADVMFRYPQEGLEESVIKLLKNA